MARREARRPRHERIHSESGRTRSRCAAPRAARPRAVDGGDSRLDPLDHRRRSRAGAAKPAPRPARAGAGRRSSIPRTRLAASAARRGRAASDAWTRRRAESSRSRPKVEFAARQPAERAPIPAAAPSPSRSARRGGRAADFDETDQAVSAAFDALSASLALQSAELAESATREILRPMLKTWLDEHLPSMVERLVRAEIQRVARGGR